MKRRYTKKAFRKALYQYHRSIALLFFRRANKARVSARERQVAAPLLAEFMERYQQAMRQAFKEVLGEEMD